MIVGNKKNMGETLRRLIAYILAMTQMIRAVLP